MSVYLDACDWQFESTDKMSARYLHNNKSIHIHKQMITIEDGFQLAKQEIATNVPLICPAINNHESYIGVCFHLAKQEIDSTKLAYPHLFCNQLNITNGYQYDEAVHELNSSMYYVSLQFSRDYLNGLHAQHGLPSWLMNFVDGKAGMLDKITVPQDMFQLAWQICQLPKDMSLVNQINMQSLALTWLAKLVAHQPNELIDTAKAMKISSDFLAEKACEIIHHHFHQPLTIKTIAKTIGTNECYLKQAFREKMGLGMHQYLTNIRLEHARYLLQHSSHLSISHIADLCGYQPNNFSQVFKKYVDMSPRAYREQFMIM